MQPGGCSSLKRSGVLVTQAVHLAKDRQGMAGKQRDKGNKPQPRPSGDGGGNSGGGGGRPPRREGKCNYCGIEGH
jgi:hypothetical protein